MANEYGVVIRKNLSPKDFEIDDTNKLIRVKYPSNLGKEGLSAYEVWKQRKPFDRKNSTIEDFIASITGPRGSDGEKGDDGASVAFSGSVDTYADLPRLLGGGNAGDGYYCHEDGLLYVWDGQRFPPQGQGIQISGERGEDGPSAFDIWRSLSPENANKSEVEFINDLRGDIGPEGKSAYQMWKVAGNEGSLHDYLASLEGEKGDSAYQVWLDQGNDGTIGDFFFDIQGPPGEDGEDGNDGESAYQVWLDQGNEGTPTDFFNSLKGPRGPEGPSAFEVFAAQEGNAGKTFEDFVNSLRGFSAYEIWLEQGNEGTENDFLTFLKGPTGDDGRNAYEVWAENFDSDEVTENTYFKYLAFKGSEKPQGHGLIQDGLIPNSFNFTRETPKLEFNGRQFIEVGQNLPVKSGKSGVLFEPEATNVLPTSYFDDEVWGGTGMSYESASPIIPNGQSTKMTPTNEDSVATLEAGSYSGSTETIYVVIERVAGEEATLIIDDPDGNGPIELDIDLVEPNVSGGGTDDELRALTNAIQLGSYGPNGGIMGLYSATVDTSAYTNPRVFSLKGFPTELNSGSFVLHHTQVTLTDQPVNPIHTDGEPVTVASDDLSGDVNTRYEGSLYLSINSSITTQSDVQDVVGLFNEAGDKSIAVSLFSDEGLNRKARMAVSADVVETTNSAFLSSTSTNHILITFNEFEQVFYVNGQKLGEMRRILNGVLPDLSLFRVSGNLSSVVNSAIYYDYVVDPIDATALTASIGGD